MLTGCTQDVRSLDADLSLCLSITLRTGKKFTKLKVSENIMFVGHRRSLKEDKRIKTRTKVRLKYHHEFILRVFRKCANKVQF